MAELLAVAFLGGFITGISPCIVPVLPVVVAGGSTNASRARPFLIIAGLVVSFSLTELVGSTVLSAIGLPQNLLFWLGIALLLILAVGLPVPVITVFYAVGATLPLLVFAVIAQRAVTGWQTLRSHLPVIRQVAGAVLAVTTLAIAFGLLDPLQRLVPGYTSPSRTTSRATRR